MANDINNNKMNQHMMLFLNGIVARNKPSSKDLCVV